MWVAGEPIGPTAGHSDGRTAKDLESPDPVANYNVADGPEADALKPVPAEGACDWREAQRMGLPYLRRPLPRRVACARK